MNVFHVCFIGTSTSLQSANIRSAFSILSNSNYGLSGKVLKSYSVTGILDCFHKCLRSLWTCKSFNVGFMETKDTYLCELYDFSVDSDSELLKEREGFTYYVIRHNPN